MAALERHHQVGHRRLLDVGGDAEVETELLLHPLHGEHVDVLEDEGADAARHHAGHGPGDLVESAERGQHRRPVLGSGV